MKVDYDFSSGKVSNTTVTTMEDIEKCLMCPFSVESFEKIVHDRFLIFLPVISSQLHFWQDYIDRITISPNSGEFYIIDLSRSEVGCYLSFEVTIAGEIVFVAHYDYANTNKLFEGIWCGCFNKKDENKIDDKTFKRIKNLFKWYTRNEAKIW